MILSERSHPATDEITCREPQSSIRQISRTLWKTGKQDSRRQIGGRYHNNTTYRNNKTGHIGAHRLRSATMEPA